MNLQTRWLNHLIRLCAAGQKQHAWHQAKHLAEICPDILADLPSLLTWAMKKDASAPKPQNESTAGSIAK